MAFSRVTIKNKNTEAPLHFSPTKPSIYIDLRSKGQLSQHALRLLRSNTPVIAKTEMPTFASIQHIYAGSVPPAPTPYMLQPSEDPLDMPPIPHIDEVPPLAFMRHHFPWLDDSDPRLQMTDAQIIREKFNFRGSTANPQEKEALLQIALKNRQAFSLRDELGTCAHVRVHLALHDDKCFFVRPYNVKPEIRPIFDREMARGEKLGIWEKGHTGYCSPCKLVPRKHKNMWRIVADFRHLNSKTHASLSCFSSHPRCTL